MRWKCVAFCISGYNLASYPPVRPGLLERIEKGDIDPSYIISHEVPLDDAPTMYQTFKHKLDGCTKVVLKPGMKRQETVH